MENSITVSRKRAGSISEFLKSLSPTKSKQKRDIQKIISNCMDLLKELQNNLEIYEKETNFNGTRSSFGNIALKKFKNFKKTGKQTFENTLEQLKSIQTSIGIESKEISSIKETLFKIETRADELYEIHFKQVFKTLDEFVDEVEKSNERKLKKIDSLHNELRALELKGNKEIVTQKIALLQKFIQKLQTNCENRKKLAKLIDPNFSEKNKNYATVELPLRTANKSFKFFNTIAHDYYYSKIESNCQKAEAYHLGYRTANQNLTRFPNDSSLATQMELNVNNLSYVIKTENLEIKQRLNILNTYSPDLELTLDQKNRKPSSNSKLEADREYAYKHIFAARDKATKLLNQCQPDTTPSSPKISSHSVNKDGKTEV